MPPTLTDLDQARDWAFNVHRDWKNQIKTNDLVAAGDWEVLWDDGTVEGRDPLVENVYLGALEDKVAAAGALLPNLTTVPTRGTRDDRAERIAQKRRRVMMSYWDRSNLRKTLREYFYDWFHTGATYSIPWTTWQSPLPERGPFILRLDPRDAYPLTHGPDGVLTEILFMRQRRRAQLEREWGAHHPAFAAIDGTHSDADRSEYLEEIWWIDDQRWGTALSTSIQPREWEGRQLPKSPLGEDVGGGPVEWLMPPEVHRFTANPVTEAKRATFDASYRGALEDIIPLLRVAQNFEARLLDDLAQNIFAPVVLDNVENYEEYGPGAILRGTGEGTANIVRDRPPVNFEAQQSVQGFIANAHQQAFWPPQRSGAPEASIVSAKGVASLTGSFNAELAWAQSDVETFLSRGTAMCAQLDEKWAPGRKKIDGLEDGREFTETYDPAVLFKGDYRNKVTYGDAIGLDEQNRIQRIALMSNLGLMSQRTAMRKSGAVEDELQEERDISIENLTRLFYDVLLPQRIQAGDLTALQEFTKMLDDDKETVRSAVAKSVEKIVGTPGTIPGAGGTPGIAPETQDALSSLAQGGQGTPQIAALRSALPALPAPAA